MMNLERHIEILLLDNDCVIVPDFGGFVAHHLCARYEESEGVFLPPLRTLGFNPQLRLNDSLLAQSYVETYDISYPEALRRIAAEVEELRSVLSRDGRYEFNDLGTISLNADGRYEFSPNESGILTPALYGLNSFEMPLLSRRPLTAEGSHEASSAPKEEDTITIRLKLSTLRNVAAACIAVMVLWLFPPTLGDSKYSTANSQFNAELLKRIMPKDITTGVPEQLAAQTAQQEEKAVVAEENAAAQPAPSFTIVLACQVGKKNAEDFVQRLHEKGFAEARVMAKGKDLRVVYGNYSDEKEAYNALRPLRQKSSDFAEGWVMKMGVQ